jgi:hypothetical protein
MGLFDIPDPINYVNEVKDQRLKEAAVTLAQSAGYSQYITFLYELGKQLEGKRFVGLLARPCQMMAASAYTLLKHEDAEKIFFTSVPLALANDKALLDSIHFEKEKNK